jgi:hypothetical protein
MELQGWRQFAEIFSLARKATQMNYQTKYLEDNAITKKKYPNFLKLFVCFLLFKLALQLLFLKTNFTVLFMM